MAFPIPAYANQPLQAPYVFQINSFQPFTNYINGQALNHNNSPYKACPVVASYASRPVRNHAIASAVPTDVDHYRAGVAVNTATRYYPSGQGGVGIVVSPLQNAAQAQTGLNNWHAVGVLRQGQTMWIHDPAYVTGSQERLPSIRGTSNVTRLLESHNFGAVNQIQVQGLSDTDAECMGRSAQFMDNVIRAPNAVAPYALNHFVPGTVTPGWQVVARY
jgi:hypothetical protein